MSPEHLRPSDRFRSSPERVSAFRELLNNPLLAEAIVVLKDEKPDATIPRDADAIVSVRVAAQVEQHEADVNLLLSLAEPLPPEQPEEEPTWQIDRSKFPLAN